MSDQDYIQQIRKGDSEAFAHLVSRYKAPAYSIALRILKNPGDAEEVVQEAFVKSFQAISRFRGDSKFSTWLYRIVYNTSISEIRRSRKNDLPVEKADNESPDFIEMGDVLSRISREESRACIQKALDNLDETDFTILTLFYYEDKSLKEISQIMDIKYNYLKVKLQRARSKLHRELKTMMKSEIYDLL